MWAGGRRGRGRGRRTGCGGERRRGAERERDYFARGNMFTVQFVEPEGEGVSVFLQEGRVDERQGEKLPALVEVLLRLAGTEKHLRKETHVLFPGVSVSRVQER